MRVSARRQVGGTALGWALALVAAAASGLSGVLGRGLMDAGWSAAAAVVVRLLVGGTVLAPVALTRLRGRWATLRRHLPLVALHGVVAVAGTQLAYFTAVRYVPVGVAMLVIYTAPVAVVGWLWLRRGERPTRLTAAGAAVGGVGLLLVLDLGGGTSPLGVLFALAGTVGAAFFFVLSSRDLGDLPAVVLAVGGMLVGGAVLLLAGLVGLVPLAASTAPVAFAGFTAAWWPTVGVLGVASGAVAYGCGIAGARLLRARLAAFAGLVEVLAALVAAWALLAQAPAAPQLLGGALIAAGVVVVRRGEPPVAGR